MRIKTKAGDLPFRTFTFPDGQQHFELKLVGDFREATIESAIKNAADLFQVLLAKDVLDRNGFITSLDVRYLLGARMDRSIDNNQPFTLGIVARILKQAGFHKIRVLDPHSGVSEVLLDATPIYPVHAVACVLAHYAPSDTLIIAPDAGSVKRVRRLLTKATPYPFTVLECSKKRDMATGNLSGFLVPDHSLVKGKRCLILDDICDGGRTFTGLTAELLKAGAYTVDLFVTHGIFSAGTPLGGIREIYTTDSYCDLVTHMGVTVIRVNMDTAESAPSERVH